MSRKKIFAEKRRREAKERRDFHRDQFIRKLLRRKGFPVSCLGPSFECFRGYNVFVDRVFKINDCAVGVVLGCGACKNAALAFDQISKGQIKDLGFECRSYPTGKDEPKLWIMQPHEIIPKPGIYTVKRSKPLYDSHGHVIEPVPQNDEPLRIRPRPSIVQAVPGVFPQVHVVEPNLNVVVNVPTDWLAHPQDHLIDFLTQILTRMPTTDPRVQKLMWAYSHECLKVVTTPLGFEFVIEE